LSRIGVTYVKKIHVVISITQLFLQDIVFERDAKRLQQVVHIVTRCYQVSASVVLDTRLAGQ